MSLMVAESLDPSGERKMNVVPTLTLVRPETTNSECRQLRAVGNDGLTDAERETLAADYRRGPGRQPGERELEDVANWLRTQRDNALLA